MSRMSRTLVLLLTLSSIPALSQSFDCKLAATPREKTICADTRLQALDAELAAAYKSLRAQLSPASADLVQSDQREWLRWLDLVCPTHGKGIADNQTRCLQNQYFTRVHDLQHIAHLGSNVIFVRSHFLYKSGVPDDKNAAPNNPGFGFGALRWPQIDVAAFRPYPPAFDSFNEDAKSRAEQLAVGFSQFKEPTFENSVDASGIIDAYYQVEAANSRIIEITFIDGTYPWGAAHPTADSSSFLYWLDRNRALTPTDVFLPNSGWQQKLVPLAIASLQSNANIKDMLWKGDELQKAVTLGIAAGPINWTLTRDNLTITFGQYAVGPYVLGMPQAHIPWDQLTPYLEPTLNPATLPAPIPKTNP